MLILNLWIELDGNIYVIIAFLFYSLSLILVPPLLFSFVCVLCVRFKFGMIISNKKIATLARQSI